MAQTDTSRSTQGQLYESESIGRILLRTTPPVMLAQLILALYNIVDSFFVGLYSGDSLTALSVVFPIQLLITALATGTGVGVNTLMSRCYALREHKRADNTGGTGMLLALVSWALFTLVVLPILRPFAVVSSDSAAVADLTFTYGSIICIGAPGVFLESIWTKVHQAAGNMRRPMAAQIVFPPIVSFVALGFALVLSVFKPWVKIRVKQ